MRPSRHDVLGSAIGFGFMGSGIGVLVGCCWMVLFDRWDFPWGYPIKGKQGVGVTVWYILRASPACFILGSIGGAWFALWANRPHSAVRLQNKIDEIE